MRILVDTNILTRSTQKNHPQNTAAVSTLLLLTQRRETLCVAPQVFYEFWVVATRPVGENGLGLTADATQAHLEDFAAAFTMLEDRAEATLRNEWSKLVIQHDVKGKAAHDARLVATMNLYGARTILTFNNDDFSRYPDITVMIPK